jgi:hypothetical protein
MQLITYAHRFMTGIPRGAMLTLSVIVLVLGTAGPVQATSGVTTRSLVHGYAATPSVLTLDIWNDTLKEGAARTDFEVVTGDQFPQMTFQIDAASDEGHRHVHVDKLRIQANETIFVDLYAPGHINFAMWPYKEEAMRRAHIGWWAGASYYDTVELVTAKPESNRCISVHGPVSGPYWRWC